ncbi:MAG: FHA domain-containing protein [Polyangiaceae bacterium]
MKKASLSLSVSKGSQTARSVSVEGPAVKLGSDPKNHLALDDQAARAMHAVIELSDDGVATIIDLGSDVGTWVNDARVNRCKLRVGDEIRIGSTMLRVELISQAS